MSPRSDTPPSAPAPGGPAAPAFAALAARSAPPLAAGVLLALFAAFQADRASAAETAYLALWVAAALLPVAALAPPPAWETTLGAPLAALAVWALPAGPARSTAVAALLAAAFALAAARALARAWSRSAPREARAARETESAPGPAGARAGAERGGALALGRPDGVGGLAPLALTLPLALGAQMLLRSELLLAPGARDVAALAALPAIGALALALLAERCGLAAALLAGAAALTLGPGWTPATVLALTGAAMGAGAGPWLDRLGERSGLRRAAAGAGEPPVGRKAPAATRHEPPSGRPEPPPGLHAPPAGGREAAHRAGSWLTLALGTLLAAGLAVETRAAAAALAAGAVVALARPHRLAAPLGLLLAAALPAAAALAPLRPWPEALPLLAWVPILLPALVWAPALPRPRWAPLAAALGLAAAGALAVPGPAAPAAGLAALAVLLAGRAGGAKDPAGGRRFTIELDAAAAGQAVWSAALLAGAALLASYPWLRPAPAAGALALVGLAPGWGAAAALAGLALAIGLGARAASRAGGRRRSAAWAAALAIGAALFAALPPPARPALPGPAGVLGPGRPRLVIELDGSPVATVDVFSHLAHAAELATGAEVASARLLGAGGESLARWTLRAGEDTGEWAARRPDVAAVPALAAPPAWLSRVESAGGAGGAAGEPYFGQSYRARWTGRPPAPAARLVIERSAALPPGVVLNVLRVEVAG